MSGALQQSRPDRQPAPGFSIGQVLSRLEADFPDLSPSKLRFLEDRGLIAPARTASGYRSFSPIDIERITLVLSMQRDHYLPLKVIRRYLADLDAGLDPAWPGTAVGAPTVFGSERRRSRDELIAEADASAALLDDAVQAGLIVAADGYDDEAAAVLKALADLAQAGIEPRHLRASRIAAEREMELIGLALLPLRHRPDSASRTRADQRAQELASRLDTVRQAVVRRALARQSP